MRSIFSPKLTASIHYSDVNFFTIKERMVVLMQENLSLLELLKRLGIHVESDLNRLIKKLLDKKDILSLLDKELLHHAELRNLLCRIQKLLLSQLQLPNKDDFAHLAKLVLQLEEKLEKLEEKLLCDSDIKHEPKKSHKPRKAILKRDLYCILDGKVKSKREKLQLILELTDLIEKEKRKNSDD